VVPASSLIPEVVIEDDGSLGRATDRASQQEVDPLVEHFVRREPDGVEEATLFQVLIDLGDRKGGIGPKVTANISVLIAGRDGLQQLSLPIGAVNVARTQHRSLAVPKLVEAE
jgi:hypothetical protein